MNNNTAYKPKLEDARFVMQKCNHCGQEFCVLYTFNDKNMQYWGSDHCNCNDFHPVNGELMFNDWYNLQVKLHGIQRITNNMTRPLPISAFF